jgi:hypothetical protein
LTVILQRSRVEIGQLEFDRQVEIVPGNNQGSNGLTDYDLTEELEKCFDEVAPDWLEIGKILSTNESAGLAHTPACVANASDFGQMLAWTKLITRLVQEPQKTIVICNDPWVFRHLQNLKGITAGKAPGLIRRSFGLWLRGYGARLRVTLKLAHTYFHLRRQKSLSHRGGSVLCVYGHPNSFANGQDGYFGDLLIQFPSLTRILHVDCKLSRVQELCATSQTTSLHAWGSLRDLVSLPFAKWRLGSENPPGDNNWLVRRAVALEGGSGQASMIEWQKRCQARWLKNCQPKAIAWPWENHSWERELVREARQQGVHSIGYQHSVIGQQMLNYSPGSNPDGLHSLPEKILCTGQTMVDQLKNWGVPDSRISVGGAFRFNARRKNNWDPKGPVYMALPFDLATSAEMVSAARSIVEDGFSFNIKPHPMTPFQFSNSPGITATKEQFYEHEKVSTVVYAASAVGLESLLANLPTLRFRPTNRISLNILPIGLDPPSAGVAQLKEQLIKITRPIKISREPIFSSVNMRIWHKELRLETSNESA